MSLLLSSKSIRALTASAVLGFGLQAQADGFPGGVQLGTPSYGGSGCPQGSAAAVLAPDGSALSLLFDRFTVEAGGATGRRIDRKNCQIAVPLQVPAGYSVTILQVDYRGFVAAPAGSRVRMDSEHWLVGSGSDGNSLKFAQDIMGPINTNVTYSNQVPVETVVTSACGAAINLRSSASLMAMASSMSFETLASIDSADLSAGLVFNLRWTRCGGEPIPQPLPPVPQPLPPAPQPLPPAPQPLPPAPQPIPHPGDSYILDQFRQLEQDALYWHGVYARASSGSWEESDARNRLRATTDRAVSLLSDAYAVGRADLDLIENEALNQHRRYNAASSGSLIESFHRQALRLLMTGLKAGLELRANSGTLSWRTLEQLMIRYQRGYAQASSGSIIEAGYRAALISARDLANQELQRQGAYLSLHELDQLVAEFYSGYARASSGSLIEAGYRTLTRTASELGLQRLRADVLHTDSGTLYSMQSHYNSLYNRASSGSILESHYRQAREVVRSEISRRGY